MENNTQPPFAVGQKVVALSTSKVVDGNQIVEGNRYHVAFCVRCSCGAYFIGVEELPIANPAEWTGRCFKGPYTHLGGHHKHFAPINPPRVSAIPELLKQPVEETLDVHPVKILTDG